MKNQNNVFSLNDKATIEELDVMFEALMAKKNKIVRASNLTRKRITGFREKVVSASQYGRPVKRIEINRRGLQNKKKIQAVTI